MSNEEKVKAMVANVRELSAAIEELAVSATGVVRERYLNRVVEAGVAIAKGVLALDSDKGGLMPAPYVGETIVVLLGKGEDVTVFPAQADFSFNPESRVFSVKDLSGETRIIDTKEYSASVYSAVGDLYNPVFFWQSDADKKKEREERKEKAAMMKEPGLEAVMKGMRETRLDSLEQAIKTWLMHNGASEGDDWFTVETKSEYKKKHIRVIVNLDDLDVSPKESNFVRETFYDALEEAIGFYRGRCSA